jgi:hypothetical protein
VGAARGTGQRGFDGFFADPEPLGFPGQSVGRENSGMGFGVAASYAAILLLTYPVALAARAVQPLALNAFSALCAAGLSLLAGPLGDAPSDRTHEQQRRRSEFSLLTISSAWLPPVFAVLVCAF